MAYQILLVEDDRQIQEILADYISDKSGGMMKLTLAKNGEEGLERFYETEFDLVLLDIMMPGMDGFALCRQLRQQSIVPIIFLTARGKEEDILYGYHLGCDDYMVKPFSLAELYAKMNALLKRAKGMTGKNEIICGDIVLNPVRLTVSVKGEPVNLPPKQYALLKYLMEHRSMVVERDTLLIRIWGYDYEGNDRVVDNHIKKLRRALGEAGSQIKTIIKRGYRMDES